MMTILALMAGAGDGAVNMLATALTFGCLAGSGFAVFSLMGNGKKIEGYAVFYVRTAIRSCVRLIKLKCGRDWRGG